MWQTLSSLRRLWPNALDRIDRINHPHRIFDSWLGTALLVGSLTFLLYYLLFPPTLLDLGGSFANFLTLVMVVAIALSLIPALVQGQSAWANILKIVTVAIGPHVVWVLLPLLT
jgi:hypothetical protein